MELEQWNLNSMRTSQAHLRQLATIHTLGFLLMIKK